MLINMQLRRIIFSIKQGTARSTDLTLRAERNRLGYRYCYFSFTTAIERRHGLCATAD